MKHPPAIPNDDILQAIRNYFGLTIASLDFLPVGEGSWAYKAIDDAGKTWFVKLSRIDTSAVGRVTAYLHNELSLPFVLSPLLAVTGAGIPHVRNTYLSVYP